jgi:tetratricopeptide (TPR) repeat protein
LLKATFLLKEGRAADARPHAVTAVTASPRSPAAHRTLGLIDAALHRDQEAVASLKRALELGAHDPPLQTTLARLHLRDGDPATSASYARAACDAAPSAADACLLLARALLASGNLADARAQLNALTPRLGDNAELYALLGRYHVLANALPRARAAWEAALKIDAANAEATAGLVELDLSEGIPGDVRARVDALLAAGEPSRSTLMLAARALAAIGDLAPAEARLREIISAGTDDVEAYQLLAQVLVKQGRLNDALREFEALGKRDAASVPVHTMMGVLLEQAGRPSEARAHYGRALAADPNAGVAANNLAWLMAEGGDNLDTALRLAQTAKARLPDRPEVDDTLGWIYYKKGLTSLAVSSLKQCVAAAPEVAVYRYHLALAYAQQGDRQSARDLMAQAVARDASFAQTETARAWLAEGVN